MATNPADIQTFRAKAIAHDLAGRSHDVDEFARTGQVTAGMIGWLTDAAAYLRNGYPTPPHLHGVDPAQVDELLRYAEDVASSNAYPYRPAARKAGGGYWEPDGYRDTRRDLRRRASEAVFRLHRPPTLPGREPTLYDRLGPEPIADAVTTFYQAVMADPELSPYFAGYDVDDIMAHQFAFLCVATGAPSSYYGGRPLREAHAPLRITAAHFDRTVDHLAATLTGAGVEPDDVDAVLARVRAFRAHIVEGGR